MHKIKKPLPQNQTDYTQDFHCTFGPLPQIAHHDKNFVDTQYGPDLYWRDNICNQNNLENQYSYNKPVAQIEGDDINIDSHVSDKLRFVLVDLWTVSLQLPGTSPIPLFTPFIHPSKARRQPVIDNEIAIQLKSNPGRKIKFTPLSTVFHVKDKERNFFFFQVTLGTLKMTDFLTQEPYRALSQKPI